MYIKRSRLPNTWPAPRKGTKYVAVARHAFTKSVPILFILRDILKIAKTRKEARYILLNKEVKINNKIRKDEKFPVQVFDIVSLEKTGKHYRLEIVNRKFKLEEISADKADKKIVKIIGKRLLKEGKVQMNLGDGQNLLTKEKFSLGDSVIINTKTDKLDKVLPLKAGASVEVIAGKYAGKTGKVKETVHLGNEKRFLIKFEEGESLLPLGSIFVVA